jgi:hypothetical protein
MLRELEFEREFYRHWGPVSEPFTGCDALISVLEKGGELTHQTCHQKTWLLNERRITIFYFWLRLDGKTVCMRVIESPTVHHVIQRMHLRIIPYSAGKDFAENSIYLYTHQLVY